ncbi:hypothetical protein [Actinoplanes sp. NPDC051411]|uniref:hypothetical protein n=1 Tax=Actinoplanes sp. NPDC051411 TaxID=3155522 RepID=UPI00341CBF82
MSCRQYGSKPTIAFWMLIAIGDSAMLLAAAGPAVMISILAALALVAGGFVAARALTRRSVSATRTVVRRRA